MSRHKARFRATTSRFNEVVTIRNYEWGEADEYGDEPRVERADSPHEQVPVAFSATADPDADRGEGRRGAATRLVMYLRDDHAAAEHLADGPSEPPSSRVGRGVDTYAVVATREQANGLVEAAVEVVGT